MKMKRGTFRKKNYLYGVVPYKTFFGLQMPSYDDIIIPVSAKQNPVDGIVVGVHNKSPLLKSYKELFELRD